MLVIKVMAATLSKLFQDCNGNKEDSRPLFACPKFHA